MSNSKRPAVTNVQLSHLHAQPSPADPVCDCCGRWEGRPSTPPFQWGDSGEVLPPHDQWLRDMNMAAWGLDKLVEPALLLTDPEFLHQDLQATKVTGCALANSVSCGASSCVD